MKVAAHPVSKSEESRQASGQKHRRLVWAVLGAILIFYVVSALRSKPTASFGILQDDGLYFSSAKALAAGQGYTLPEFPGQMPSMKYPKLYPLLLAAVWKLDPQFPRNLRPAVGLTLSFGCLFLVFAFLWLREWPGMSDWEALVVAGVCGLSGEFLQMSSSVMSDVPFCALALGSAWLGTRVLRRDDQGGLAALGAGLLVGFSVGFKSLGLAIAAGIGLALLMGRRYRLLAWFCAAAVPVTMVWFWPAFLSLVHSTKHLAAMNPGAAGWRQTVCYYSSYGCNWRMGVSSLASLEAVVRVNLTRVLLSPGLYALAPLGTQSGVPGLVLVALASVAGYVGITRYARSCPWDPMTLAFAFFLLMIVPWPWTPERFLLVFLPLFFGGLWRECRRLAMIAARAWKQGAPLERAIGGVLGACVALLFVAVGTNISYSIPVSQHQLGTEHAKILADERGAYAWMRQHTAPDTRILAFQDGLTYLYTGRPAVEPLAILPQSFFQHEARYARQDAAHLGDVGAHIGADYWLTSPYDSNFEDPGKFGIVQKRQRQLLTDAPVVYRSSDGHVILYDTRCLWKAVAPDCGSAPGKQR